MWITKHDYNVCSYKPASGEPKNELIPWHNTKRPKELVNLSKPIKSTNMIDLNETKAAKINKVCSQINENI